RIVEGYGLTETTGFCVTNPLYANKPPSIGKPYSYVETKIVNEAVKYVASMMGFFGATNMETVVIEGHNQFPDKAEEIITAGLEE
ncbi:AMP-binding protein, partial [Bacillus cereus]